MHKFFNIKGIWMIYCSETKGNFSTELWRLGKVKPQQCACCNQHIKAKQ